MKDIKKEKKEEKSNWLGRLETAGELASTGLYLRQMARAAEPAIPVMQTCRSCCWYACS